MKRGSGGVEFVDLRTSTEELWPEIEGRLRNLLNKSNFIMGDEVEEFENRFAAYCGASHAIGVGSGTDALLIALKAFGIGVGDEVITVANSFVATAEAIVLAGATPVLVDADSETFNIDARLIEEKITSATRAIMPVHLYGRPAEMGQLRAIAEAHGLLLIEDSCQAHGAYYQGQRTGTLGHAAAFSFYPGKNLGAWGDGGCIVTNDPQVAEQARLYRNHGEREKYQHVVVGYCSRLDPMQAAVLNVKLKYLDTWNENRRRAAGLYASLLDPELDVPASTGSGTDHVFHLYVIRAADRDSLRSSLAADGIQTGIHYPVPIHANPAFRDLGLTGDFPVSERLAAEIISLPMHPHLTEEEIAFVCRKVNEHAAFTQQVAA